MGYNDGAAVTFPTPLPQPLRSEDEDREKAELRDVERLSPEDTARAPESSQA